MLACHASMKIGGGVSFGQGNKYILVPDRLCQPRKDTLCQMYSVSPYLPQFQNLVQIKVHSPQKRCDMNGRFQIQGGKNWIFSKEMNANWFFWDSHWLEIWPNHLCPSIGPNGGSMVMDPVHSLVDCNVQCAQRKLAKLSHSHICTRTKTFLLMPSQSHVLI